MNTIVAQYFYKGTPVDFTFDTEEQLSLFQGLLTIQIKTGMEAGRKIPEQIVYMTAQLDELEQLIVEAVGFGNEYSGHNLKAIWGKDWKQQKTLFAMNVMSLIKVRALQNDNMNGEMVMHLPKAFADTLSTEKYVCKVCETRCTTKCERCKSIWYCCREHQEQDWKAHKKNCFVAPV
jgi:hypothetical protein